MSDYTNQIKNLISEKTGTEINEVTNESFFEDDLNIGELEMIEILEELEEQLEINLIDSKKDMETVGDLLDVAADRIE